MSFTFMPAKLLIGMVGHHKGEQFMAAARGAGARGGTIAHGRAMVDSKILQMLSLADMHQEIVFTLLREEAEAVIENVRELYSAKAKKIAGIAIVLNVAGMLARLAYDNPAENNAISEPDTGARSEKMESRYTLLTIIVNHGYADDVMAKAREAGARGGTIMTARGTASPEDVKFFGITLVPEKEMLMIVAENSVVEAIVAAIRTVPSLAEPGGGIVYSMNVEQFILLGQ